MATMKYILKKIMVTSIRPKFRRIGENEKKLNKVDKILDLVHFKRFESTLSFYLPYFKPALQSM